MTKKTFKQKLQDGKFVTTIELSPPKGVAIEEILEKADKLKEMADAINVTDNQRATMHASPLSLSHLLEQRGLEPIFQITCRDRNGMALQSELLSAYILGIRNILVVSGDYPNKGDHPYAKPVYDLDSVQLLKAISKMQSGLDFAGNRLKGSLDFFVGGVANPTATPQEMHMIKLNKKYDAGLDFIQTQVIYDPQTFNEFAKDAPDVPILAGIFPLKSEKMARFMNDKVPGVKVPDWVIKRLSIAKDPEGEGIKMTIDLINKIKHHAQGIHIMAMNNTELIERIVNSI